MADKFFQFQVTGPEGDPWQVQLPAAPVQIGRDPAAEIVLDHPDVEPQHLLVNPLSNKIQIMNLSSGTGTFMDGTSLAPNAIVSMVPGSTLRIGPFQLTSEEQPGTPPKKVVVKGRSAVVTPISTPQPAVATSPQQARGASAFDLLADSPAPVSSNDKKRSEAAAVVPVAPPQPAPAPPAAAPQTTATKAGATPVPAAAPASTADDASLLFRKKALEKLQSPEQLNELMTVTSPKAWLVLTALVALLVAAGAWAFLGIVETTVMGNGILVQGGEGAGSLEAVVYLSPADAARIRLGMPARVSPVTARKEEFGMMRGAVLSVSPAPATVAQIEQTLGNDALARSLIASGALVEVRVGLVKDVRTATGYRWTTATGPDAPIRPGTIANGSIVISQDQPIALIFSTQR